MSTALNFCHWGFSSLHARVWHVKHSEFYDRIYLPVRFALLFFLLFFSSRGAPQHSSLMIWGHREKEARENQFEIKHANEYSRVYTKKIKMKEKKKKCSRNVNLLVKFNQHNWYLYASWQYCIFEWILDFSVDPVRRFSSPVYGCSRDGVRQFGPIRVLTGEERRGLCFLRSFLFLLLVLLFDSIECYFLFAWKTEK